MVIGSRQLTHGRALDLFFNDIILWQASTVKYFDVYIDQHLTWKYHVEHVLQRVLGKLYSINRLKPLTINVMRHQCDEDSVSGTYFIHN